MSIKGLSRREFMLPGTAACPGCGLALALRHALKALGDRTILVVPAGCTSVIQGIGPNSSFAVPTLNIAFAASAAAASGIVNGLDVQEIRDVNVAVWAGDGGTADIGIQALSGAAERMTDMIYFCCDNESYMNTGIQRSSSTPQGAWTTTTPTGKREPKKDMQLIMAAHRIPYIATACSSYPIDLHNKVEEAKKIRGTKYIHILAPCPTGWRYPSEKTVEVGRLAIETGIWPLYKIQDGRFTISIQSKPLVKESRRRPVKEYLEVQGRFSHLTSSEIDNIQGMVSAMWEHLSLMDNRDLLKGW
ncbi:MAG: pyruvate synthase subunit PorB [Candidatus Bathyarchaeia archaeon]